MAGGEHPPNINKKLHPSDMHWLCDIGDELELWRFPFDGPLNKDAPYAITVPQYRLRHGGGYNYTRIELEPDGNLRFLDNDVQPTPYELCLIYAAIHDHEAQRRVCASHTEGDDT